MFFCWIIGVFGTKSVKDRWHFGKKQIKIWSFAQFELSLASITASHEVLGCQSSMNNVAIKSLYVDTLLRNGVTLNFLWKQQRGEVNKETVDKCIDFLFANACASFRTIPYIDESTN